MPRTTQVPLRLLCVFVVILFAGKSRASSVTAGYTAHDLYTLSGGTPNLQMYESAAGEQVIGLTYVGAQEYLHAAVWNGSGAVTDLNPAGFTETEAFASDGAQQVGGAPNDNRGFTSNALLWTGTAASAVNLNPVGFNNSIAYGLFGNQQVGSAALTANGNYQAFLWNGSAASAVNLAPTLLPNITRSEALATDGTQQVGQGNFDAMLWSGTGASAVDLASSGYSTTYALGLVPNQQVGSGYNTRTGTYDALIWSNTAASVVDLSGPDYSETQAIGTNGQQQVGFGFTPANDGERALVWSGTADSVVDLGSFLAAGPGFKISQAFSIDSAGDIFGTAEDSSNNIHAIEWTPNAVPEPAGLAMLTAGGMILARRRAKAEKIAISLEG